MNTVEETSLPRAASHFKRQKTAKMRRKEVEWTLFIATEKFTSREHQNDLQQSQKLNPDLKDPSSKQGQYEPR